MEDKDYIKCPFCNQLARRKDIESGIHICWSSGSNSRKTLGVWDD
jgi:acetyl-CoA carboxylase beta subunit